MKYYIRTLLVCAVAFAVVLAGCATEAKKGSKDGTAAKPVITFEYAFDSTAKEITTASGTATASLKVKKGDNVVAADALASLLKEFTFPDASALKVKSGDTDFANITVSIDDTTKKLTFTGANLAATDNSNATKKYELKFDITEKATEKKYETKGSITLEVIVKL